MLALGGAAAGCDQGTPKLSDSGKGPPPQVTWHSPSDEEKGVALQQSIRVQFDRFLTPLSATRQGLCLQAASVGGQSPDECIGGTLAPEYDPVDRVAVWKPTVPLLPHTRYNARVLAPKGPDDVGGVRAFDGVALAKEVTFAFETGDAASVAKEPKRAIDFCTTKILCRPSIDVCSKPFSGGVPSSPANVLQYGCTGDPTCHGVPDKPRGEARGSVLSLDDGEAKGGTPSAVRRLVETQQVATETATAQNPGAARVSVTDRFGQNMPYVDRKNPGNSYLLYKMILALPSHCPFRDDEEAANPDRSSCAPTETDAGSVGVHWGNSASFYDFYDCEDLEPRATDPSGMCPADAGITGTPRIKRGHELPSGVDPWISADEWKPPAAGEYARLRSRIRGDMMPPSGTTHSDALTVSAWISAGAETPACPQ
ncbi:MAG TPA: Ig-like domain-containing protein [Polyangiaceae bacterium]|nr:Ig-like domain-containing protein [Polyangiaceae bacterium]